MRTINATLLSDQKSLGGDPCWSLVIGTSPNTIDVSAFVVSYDYEERHNRPAGLTVYLDNSGGEFSPTRSGSYAYLTEGAIVEFKRGRTVSGTDYLEELPRLWVETIDFDYYGGTACCAIRCIDWRGRLQAHRLASAQSWNNTSATTILEWILTQVGLTRASGTMTSTTLEFDIDVNTNLHTATRSLMSRLPEYLYSGIDAEVKWKDIDGSDASDYTLGWNAQHPVLHVQAGNGAWAINSITVNGRSGTNATVSDNTQINLVGTRRWTIYDTNLSTNAECEQRAIAELDLFEAEATRMYVVCRPIHGLELLDVLTLDSPPWSGDNFVGRVISYREEWNHNGRWHQVIGIGATTLKDPGNQPAKKRRSSGRPPRPPLPPPPIDPPYDPIEDPPFLVPLGAILLWSGTVAAIPSGYALCDGNNGTPDLRNSFIVGAGDTYDPGDSGGNDSIDLSHTHGPGTLNTADDEHTHSISGATASDGAHTHGPGTLNTADDTHDHDVDSGTTASDGAHTHGPGTLSTDSDSHDHDVDSGTTASDEHTHGIKLAAVNVAGAAYGSDFTATTSGHDHQTPTEADSHSHGPGTLNTDSDSHDHDVDSGTTASDGAHTHGPGTLNTDSDTHDHDVDSGTTASDGAHTHDPGTLALASDTHDHNVDSGETATALSASTDIRPVYYALCFIMRIV